MPEKPFEIFEEDFVRTMMDYELFMKGIDVKDFKERLLQKVLYSSQISQVNNNTTIVLKGE